MNIRSHMTVNHDDGKTLYVLVEGRVGDCAVYMREYSKGNPIFNHHVRDVAMHGEKVSILKVDTLPFTIPSDLTYRA